MPVAAANTFFDELRPEKVITPPVLRQESLRAQLAALPAGRQRRTFFEDQLREQVAKVLHLALPRVRLNMPFKTLGMDSLMALELRNRLEATLGLTLSATLIFNYPTIEHLIPYLAQKMGVDLDVTEDSTMAQEKSNGDDLSGAHSGNIADKLTEEPTEVLTEELTQEEISVLLAEELALVDDVLKGA